MKDWKNIAGTTFALAAMCLVLYLYGGDLTTIDIAKPGLLGGLIGAVALYVLVVLLGAFAWGVLLKSFGAMPLGWAAERQLLIAQIGKYVPGNVVQYAGRAALAIGAGTPSKIVGLALVIETVLTVVGGFLTVFISMLVAPQQATQLLKLLPGPSSLPWLGMAIVAIALILTFIHVAATRWSGVGAVPTIKWAGLGAATLVYTATQFILGISLYLILVPISSVSWSVAVAVFAAAWTAGFATPGAPGGLGVRESVIAVGLAPFIGGPTALWVALLHRGASVVGDVISFGLGLLLPKNASAT